MARSMPSEELQLLIAGYVLGDLDVSEAAEFEQLLAQNPAIAEEVAQMQTALEHSHAPPEIAPPAHLRSAILGALETIDPLQAQAANQPAADQLDLSQPTASQRTTLQSVPLTQSVPPTQPVPPTYRSPFSWTKAWSIAAAVLIAVLGISNYRLWQTLQATRTETQPANALTYTLQGTEPNSPASATLVVNPSMLNAELTVRELPPPPPGKTYVLWTVLQPNAPFTADAKNAVLTEVLNPDPQGSVEETIAVPSIYRSSQFVAKVAVTLEDATAPQAHTGTPVLITGL